MSTVISVSNVSKSYQLGVIGSSTLRDEVARWWAKLSRKPDPLATVGEAETKRLVGETFWALQGIDFKVSAGEVLGIIGHNGAGKSTLLKLLSRVTAPTDGWIGIRGHIASLLEVGTGFHPELTGRENIFLNGAILGMRKSEIARKLDEIVAFAEIEEFLDTPVKRYSSGMYVRLAFAVAAHLEPEILIVDEVLAVGDAQFQKKCLGKMKDVSGHGRTVIFVSHNMAAVRALCSRAILLKGGRVIEDGDSASVTASYLGEYSEAGSAHDWTSAPEPPGNEHIRLEFISVTPPPGEKVITVDTGAVVDVGFYNVRAGINLDCTFYLTLGDGSILFEAGCILSAREDSKTGSHRVRWELLPHFLNCGRFGLNLIFGRDQRYILFQISDVVSFHVENSARFRGLNMSIPPGPVRPLVRWNVTLPGAVPVSDYRVVPTLT